MSERGFITDWLTFHGLRKYQSAFDALSASSIEDILKLTVEDLRKMGITKIGARRKILAAIEHDKIVQTEPCEQYGLNPYANHEARNRASRRGFIFPLLYSGLGDDLGLSPHLLLCGCPWKDEATWYGFDETKARHPFTAVFLFFSLTKEYSLRGAPWL